MANNRFPYGDAFLVQTPYLDRVGAMMINDQKQREANQAKEAQALDQEFGKNISGMRDADIPELTQKWGEYKNLKKQLYKDGSKLDDNKRIELQLEAQRKLGEAYKHINKSKAEKEQEDFYAKDVINDKNGKYDDIASQFLMERRKRPISQFQAALPNIGGMKGGTLDFADIPGNIEYKLGTTNFTPIISKAKGTQSLRGEPIDVVSPDGLTTTRTQYKAVNSPTEYIKQLQAGVVGSKKTKHLPLEFNYSDDEANQIINDYAKLRETDAFKKAYPNEPEISSTLMATPTGRAMALMAMENAVLHPPDPIVSRPFPNMGAVMDRKLREKLDFATIQQQRKEKNIKLNKEGGGSIEFDNIPLKLEEETKSVPMINPDTKKIEYVDLVDITDYPQSYKNDIFTDEKNSRTGALKNRPIVVQDREYIKKTPDGWVGENNYKVNDKDIYTRTYKRSVPNYEKPVGTGKAKVRAGAAGQSTGKSNSNNNPLDLDL